MDKQEWKPGNMLYPVPAVMVSCCDEKEVPNIITVAWTGTICSDPVMVSISVRPERYSYEMIKKTGEFVINLTTRELTRATDWCGVKSGRDVDKFSGYPDCKRSSNGLYYVTAGSNGYISAVTEQAIDLGSHTLFIASVSDMEVLSAAPSATYAYYHSSIKPQPQKPAAGKTVWRCTVCGYVYEGEELPADFICPLCKHPASDFEKITQ